MAELNISELLFADGDAFLQVVEAISRVYRLALNRNKFMRISTKTLQQRHSAAGRISRMLTNRIPRWSGHGKVGPM